MLQEGLMTVKITMIQIVHYLGHRVFNYPEIYSHAEIIQLSGPYSYFDVPVMAMRFLAITGVIPQVVAG